ncbi:hypothetical protein I3760_06G137300 [Carya illinoinensis]|nr:hypothetical protein I3760_06G137300 [Carya illinoinensis]
MENLKSAQRFDSELWLKMSAAGGGGVKRRTRSPWTSTLISKSMA